VAVSLYVCRVITLAMAPVLLFKGRTADNRVDEKEKDDPKVKRSKRKTMITTGPSQGIGGGITNAFLDPRLPTVVANSLGVFKVRDLSDGPDVSRRKHRQGFGTVELQMQRHKG